jgi:enamine deaminase RidA (YjgF/YER057c/UK114 family)
VPLTPIAPTSIAPPAANYAHGIVVTSPTRWLHTAGVVPIRPDGTVPDAVAEQAEVVWSNVEAILAAAEMGVENVVSVTTYVVASAAESGLGEVMQARDRALGGRRVASTLVTVPALAQPAWSIEVALVAATS